MQPEPISQQFAFLLEIDRLKSVLRQSPLLDKSRKENSAEHSWHLAMYALLLHDHAIGHVDTSRVIKMLLIHDIVEVDVGDTPIHGGSSASEQAKREQLAARRLFGLLPKEQFDDLQGLWQEFEESKTQDARFAKALDRVQPLLVNIFTGGGTWTESGVTHEQVLARYGPTIQQGSPSLWAVCEALVNQHFGSCP